MDLRLTEEQNSGKGWRISWRQKKPGACGEQEPQGAHSNITGPGSPGHRWGNMGTQGGLWGGWALWLLRLWAGAAPPLDRRKGGFQGLGAGGHGISQMLTTLF